MKNYLVAALCVVSGAARASFELVLVADDSTKSIHRFDGVSGAYFGEYGKGDFAVMSGLTVDRATGRSYALDYSRQMLLVHNYSTGLLEREVNVSGWVGLPLSVSMTSGGDILLGGYNNSVRINRDFNLLTTYGSAMSALSQGADGAVYGVVAGNNVMRRFTLTGSFTGQTTLPALSSVLYWQSVHLSGKSFLNMTTGNGLQQFTAANPPVASSSFFTSELFGITALGIGHGSTLYVGGRLVSDVTKGGISRYSVAGASPFYRSAFGSSVLKSPISIATVVAPEPGTLVACGIGLAALAARRRKIK